jgi:hypothetical protein
MQLSVEERVVTAMLGDGHWDSCSCSLLVSSDYDWTQIYIIMNHIIYGFWANTTFLISGYHRKNL